MMGIIVNDLDTLIKKNDLEIDNLREKISSLRLASLSLRNSIRCSELTFLTEKLSKEISLCSNVQKKINSYQISLKSVLRGYQNQNDIVSSAIKRITPLD